MNASGGSLLIRHPNEVVSEVFEATGFSDYSWRSKRREATDMKDFLENIRCLLTGRYEEGRTDLNTLWNPALIRVDRRMVTPSLKHVPG